MSQVPGIMSLVAVTGVGVCGPLPHEERVTHFRVDQQVRSGLPPASTCTLLFSLSNFTKMFHCLHDFDVQRGSSERPPAHHPRPY